MFFVWSVVFLVSFSKQNIFTTVTNRYEASKHIPNNQTAQNKQKYSIFPDLAQDRIYIRKPCDQKKTCLYVRYIFWGGKSVDIDFSKISKNHLKIIKKLKENRIRVEKS